MMGPRTRGGFICVGTISSGPQTISDEADIL